MAYTVRDLIRGSMRLLGVYSSGETPANDEMQDALSVLNEMLDSWSTESLNIYANVREVFDLAPGQQSYTMGTGGNFNTSKPVKILNAQIQVQGTNPAAEYPLELINQAQWAELAVKTVTGTLPTKLYVEKSHPLETLSFWPLPSAAQKVVINSHKALTAFSTIGATVDLPPGYQKALRYNLAIALAPEYGKSANTEVVAGALESKENIKKLNIEPQFMSVDSALSGGRGFNWMTGE